MIDRRSQGIRQLHALFLSIEAVLLWGGLALSSRWLPYYNYYSLLAPWVYPVCIALAVGFALRTVWRIEPNLATLGWVGSMQLTVRQIACVAGAIFAMAVASKDPGLSRVFVAVYLGLASGGFTLMNRYQPGWLMRRFLSHNVRVPMLVMGDARNFPDLDHWLEEQKTLGLSAEGRITYQGTVPNIDSLPIVGDFEDLEQVIVKHGARQVLALNLPARMQDADRLAKVCAEQGCRLMIHNDLLMQVAHPLQTLAYGGHDFLVFHDEPLEDPLNRSIKRVFDLALALPMVAVVLPVLIALVWLLQRLQSPGPLFYRQMRTGRGGRVFRMWKFRTMHVDAGQESRQTSPGDLRIFAAGRWLRRTSLDEVPQFLNVLSGSMSVVGPRPHHVDHDPLFAGYVDIYRMRFFVKPGITGLAQSRGVRGEVRHREEMLARIRLDLLYIRSWSVWMDLAIVLRTLRQIVLPPDRAV